MNQFVYHNKPIPIVSNGKSIKATKSVTFTHRIYEKLDLNLNEPKINSLIIKDEKLNIQLDHYANALKAIYDQQHGEAIRRFC